MWSMDWLPSSLEQEQEPGYNYIALSAYKRMLQVLCMYMYMCL